MLRSRRIGLLGVLWLASGCMADMKLPPAPATGADANPPPDAPVTCADEPVGAPPNPADLDECCPDYGGAHCVDRNAVPASLRPRLDACSGDQLCVPDPFITGGVDYRPQSCASLGGADGVCLSGCLPEIRDVYDLLPQDLCADGERCAPCVNPVDGLATGACDTADSCETPVTDGDTSDAGVPNRCCSDRGVCLAPEVVGERAGDLGPDSCPADSELLCVPDVFIAGGFEPATCNTGLIALIFGDAYREGRCLPECLPAMDNLLLGRDDCAEGFTCAPCLDPITTMESGACDPL